MIKKYHAIDLICVISLIFFSAWLYLIPVLNNPGTQILFSDDAIFGITARNVVRLGSSAAYNLTWAPLFPWLMALLNIYSVPLEDTGRLITAVSLVLYPIPVYFLAKILFNRSIAITCAFLTLLTPTFIVTKYFALSDGLYSLIVLTGFLSSILALKYQQTTLFLISGVLWGMAYLTRFEGWLFILIPFLLALITGYANKNKKMYFQALVMAIFFALTASPYLIFSHQAFGSWTLNPRIGITMVIPGPNFMPFKDNFGLTTPAQVYFSGEPKYYASNLWHPKSFEVVRNFSRSWDRQYIIPKLYLQIFLAKMPLLFILGLLGVFTVVAKSLYRKYSFIFLIFLFVLLLWGILDFTMRTLMHLDSIGDRDFTDSVYTILKLRFKHNYYSEIVRNILIIISAPIFIIINIKNIPKLLKHVSKTKIILYLPLSLILGFFPLFFNSPSDKYTAWINPLLAIYSTYFVFSIYYLIKRILNRLTPNHLVKLIPSLVFIIILISVIKPHIIKTLAIRDYPKTSHGYFIQVFKKPGLVILHDFGPGAKIALFHESPAFYAQGVPFYFITSHDFAISETLSYFEKNNVDYFTLHADQAKSYRWLEVLLDPNTKLENWQQIYNDTSTVSVWKRTH